MRLFVLFDVPVETAQQRKEYAKFRKWLVKNGYVMLQYSVYSKLCINTTRLQYEINKLKCNKPKFGIVQALRVTEKQYASIELISGTEPKRAIEEDSIDDLIII